MRNMKMKTIALLYSTKLRLSLIGLMMFSVILALVLSTHNVTYAAKPPTAGVSRSPANGRCRPRRRSLASGIAKSPAVRRVGCTRCWAPTLPEHGRTGTPRRGDTISQAYSAKGPLCRSQNSG